jgi:hypothetical protein
MPNSTNIYSFFVVNCIFISFVFLFSLLSRRFPQGLESHMFKKVVTVFNGKTLAQGRLADNRGENPVFCSAVPGGVD